MIYQNIEFFNVAELETVPGFTGVRLQRFPKEVRDKLEIKGNCKSRLVAQHSTGSEIRFVTDAPMVRLYLSAADSDGEALIYRGNFFHSKVSLKAGVITPIMLDNPPQFANVMPECLEKGSFSSKVWRVLFNRYCAVYHGIDAFGHSVRPPEENEVPRIKWLAYGSSITHGASSQSFENSYVQQAAKRLGADVYCFGMSGNCYCEKAMADFIASQTQCDIFTLELGVNMRGPFTPEEFEERVNYIVDAILEKNPGKPVVLLTIFPNYADCLIDSETTNAVRNRKFNEILRKIHKERNHPDLHLIEGSDVLTDFTGLACDLLHPSAYGHILMGENLARELKTFLK